MTQKKNGNIESNMKLKNFLIVVNDIEKSKKYYNDLFGLKMLTDNDGNLIEVGTPMKD